MFKLIIENWKDISLVLTSVITIASVIVKLTPNKKDDKILSKILQIIALNKK